MSALLRAFYHILLSFICWREFLRIDRHNSHAMYFQRRRSRTECVDALGGKQAGTGRAHFLSRLDDVDCRMPIGCQRVRSELTRSVNRSEQSIPGNLWKPVRWRLYILGYTHRSWKYF